MGGERAAHKEVALSPCGASPCGWLLAEAMRPPLAIRVGEGVILGKKRSRPGARATPSQHPGHSAG